ncbi:hypothetical protein Droror1_Dr00025603, partial [Drosera rotundifolia]
MMGSMMDRLLEQVLQRVPALQPTPPTTTVEERTPATPAHVPPTRAERAKSVAVRSAQPPTEAQRLFHFQGQTNTPYCRHPESQVPPVDDSDEENEALSFIALENMALQHEATASRRPMSGTFTQVIHDVPFFLGLRMPNFNHYDRTTDLEDHVNTFEIRMQLYNVEDAILCRAFPSTFIGAARQWFASLAPQSISRFSQLRKAFVGQFACCCVVARTAPSLFAIRQKPNESLREFMFRFNRAYIQIPGLSGEVAVVALQTRLLP